MKTFKSPLSSSVKWITIVVLVMLVWAIISLTRALDGSIWNMVAVVVLILTIVITVAYIPLSVKLTDSALEIRKVIGSRVIPYGEIQKIAPFEMGRGDLRLFGSGGLGGYLGLFTNHQIGRYTSYITHGKQGVLILTSRGAIAFSCENRDELIEEIVNKQA